MAQIRNGSTYLSVHLSANDYYSEGEKVQGEWIGKLAEHFGIAGKPIQSDDISFEHLRLNLTPDGSERLTPRQPDIRFFDFQCSAQKSVSIMAVTMGDNRLRQAHRQAVRIALGELEQFAACRARRGESHALDQNRLTSNLCAALFDHDASRALDPQLHTHAVIVNATLDPATGKILALTEREMLKAIRYAGKVYQNALASKVQQLGYEIEIIRKNGNIEGFEIRGVSEEVRQRFSKRRAEVEAAIQGFIAQYGHEPSTAEIHAITTSTRPAKLAEITTAEVRTRQTNQLSEAEFRHLESIKLATVPQQKATLQSSLSAAISHLFERKSVLPGYAILAEALNQGLGGQDLETLKQELGTGDLISLVDQGLSSEYATKAGLRQEEWCKEFINGTRDRFTPAIVDFQEKLAALDTLKLREDQLAAAEAICTSRDQVIAIRGLAGTGKTYMLRAVHQILSEKKVYYIAPTASAAKVMVADGLPNATTCADFLENVARSEDLRNAIVVCDEAGLQSNRQGFALLQLAQTHEMRVCLVGDARQHVSIEAGDFLRVMEAHSNLATTEVGTIERQQHQEYRQAIFCMAQGEAKVGLQILNELGWIKEGRSDYLTNAASDYARLTSNGANLSNTLAVAPTWDENHRLTEKIRAHLKTAGLLADGTETTVHHSLKWTKQQKRTAGNYQPEMILTFNNRVLGFRKGQSAQVLRIEDQNLIVARHGKETSLPCRLASAWDVAEQRQIEVAPGDRIIIRANSKPQGLVNGDVLTVSSIDADGTIHTREGKRIPQEFKQWCHGYVLTSYKAQGATANQVIVAAARLDQKTAYVACSRGRQQCTVHTPDTKRLLERLPPGDRQAALEVMAKHPSYAPPKHILARAAAWLKLRAEFFQTFSKAARAGHGLSMAQSEQTIRHKISH